MACTARLGAPGMPHHSLARIIHEGFVNNLGLPDQWPIPPVRKIPDRDGGMTHGGGHTGYPSARTGAVSSCTSDA